MIVAIGDGRSSVPERGSPEFLLIYRTLGVFSVLATYAESGIIPRDLVRKVWRDALLDMKNGAEVLRDAEIVRRKGSRGEAWKPWADLWELYKWL